MGKGGSGGSSRYSGSSASVAYTGSARGTYASVKGIYRGRLVYKRNPNINLNYEGVLGRNRYMPSVYLKPTYDPLKSGSLSVKNSLNYQKNSGKYIINDFLEKDKIYGNLRSQYINKISDNQMRTKQNNNIENLIWTNNLLLRKNYLNSKKEFKDIFLNLFDNGKKDYNIELSDPLKTNLFKNNLNIDTYEDLKVCPICGKLFLFCECSKN